MDLTAWFDFKKHKPVHVGVYEVVDRVGSVFGPWYSYWDGSRFCNWSLDIDRASGKKHQRESFMSCEQWRGVRKKS